MNASTSGSDWRSSLENRCDMHPLTISFCCDLLLKPRCRCASRIASIDSSLAESMNAHVFITRTSASCALAVISIPCCKTLPSMISASTRFLAQPRLIIPTFVLIFGKTRHAALFDGDVGVALGDQFSVFLDLDSVAIEDAHDNMFSAELHRAV